MSIKITRFLYGVIFGRMGVVGFAQIVVTSAHCPLIVTSNKLHVVQNEC